MIRDIISSVIDQYGVARTRYAVIVFGKTPSIKVKFSDNIPTETALKNLVKVIPRSRDDPAIAKTLDAAKMLFESESRSNVKKILVVITDKKSDDTAEEVKTASKLLEDAKVTVISVVFGGEADRKELENTTPDKRNVVEANTTSDPTEVAKQIMDKAVKCTLIVVLC